MFSFSVMCMFFGVSNPPFPASLLLKCATFAGITFLSVYVLSQWQHFLFKKEVLTFLFRKASDEDKER